MYTSCNFCLIRIKTFYYRPIETDVDEFHSKATRTLFIGNLNSNSSAADLRKTFETFGEIIVSFNS